MAKKTLNKKIEWLLEDWGLSQADLAGILGLTRSAVNGWIKGKTSPDSRKLKQLADLFRIDVLWFRDDNAGYPPEARFHSEKPAPARLAETPSKQGSNDVLIESPFVRPGAERLALKAISRHLFRVNDPEVRALLLGLEEALKHSKGKEILSLLNHFIETIENGSEKNAIKVHILKKRGDVK